MASDPKVTGDDELTLTFMLMLVGMVIPMSVYFVRTTAKHLGFDI